MTGITDSMRSDFTMMREMSNRTRLDPGQRVANLEKFMYRINSYNNKTYGINLATAGGREGKKFLLMRRREPTPKVPPLDRGARGGWECRRKCSERNSPE
ncbi:hypothetical protein TNCV_1040231 [Trichonephila clavipes]|nr:hypothetical protein TNCV_1040231 [Trichonephila clavipes]